LSYPVKLALLCFSGYFFWNEVVQMIGNGVGLYFSSVWNYIDILTPTIIPAVVVMSFTEDKDDVTSKTPRMF
jgi:hypothetical protein